MDQDHFWDTPAMDYWFAKEIKAPHTGRAQPWLFTTNNAFLMLQPKEFFAQITKEFSEEKVIANLVRLTQAMLEENAALINHQAKTSSKEI